MCRTLSGAFFIFWSLIGVEEENLNFIIITMPISHKDDDDDILLLLRKGAYFDIAAKIFLIKFAFHSNQHHKVVRAIFLCLFCWKTELFAFKWDFLFFVDVVAHATILHVFHIFIHSLILAKSELLHAVFHSSPVVIDFAAVSRINFSISAKSSCELWKFSLFAIL